jgi:hypothetical protein
MPGLSRTGCDRGREGRLDHRLTTGHDAARMSPAEDRTQTGTGDISGAELRTPVSLVVAHPGHELLALGWLTRVRPLVFVVTDGSGRDADPRIGASAKLLAGGLGTRASIFGRWTDRELYDALYEGRFQPFLALRDELVEAWCGQKIRTVICDAYERRILMHDVVQITASAAVAAAAQRGVAIDLLELPIYLGPLDARPGNPPLAASLAITNEILAKKIEAAQAYESAVVRHEVEEFLRQRTAEGFRVESLLRSMPRTPDEWDKEPKPEWEAHGERLLTEGVYDRVIRLRDHLVPLARALGSPADVASESR